MDYSELLVKYKEITITSKKDILDLGSFLNRCTTRFYESNDLDKFYADKLFKCYAGRYDNLKLEMYKYWRENCTNNTIKKNIVSKGFGRDKTWVGTLYKTIVQEEDRVKYNSEFSASPVKESYKECKDLVEKFRYLKDKGHLPYDDVAMWKRLQDGKGHWMMDEAPEEHLDGIALKFGYVNQKETKPI